MKAGKINIIIDGQWGSTGKGKIVGYLATHRKIDVAVCNFMPNAGHTFVDGEKKFLFRQLPVASVNKDAVLVLASTSAIDINLLIKEIQDFEDAFGFSVRDRLFIDSRAVIIKEDYIHREKESLYRIASTMKGCGAALADKIMRSENVVLAKDSQILGDQFNICDTSHLLYNFLLKKATIIGELPQGFDLSINLGYKYPYVTSRDITPMQFMNDIGIPFQLLGDVYGVIRTFPIRVGNTKAKEIAEVDDYGENTSLMEAKLKGSDEEVGYSGEYYIDQKELSWHEVSKIAGKDVKEMTSVTGRVRRVFTFSPNQYRRFLRICAPNKLCITFADYIGFNNDSLENDKWGTIMDNDVVIKIRNVHKQEELINTPVISFFGYGNGNNDIIDLEDMHEEGIKI